MKKTDSLYLQICLKYIYFISCVFAVFLLGYTSQAYAGIVRDIGDIGVRIAVINLWKGLGGLALFLGGCYMMANRRPFRYRIMAFAAAFMLITMTVIGFGLFIAEFWPVIGPVVRDAANMIRGF